MKLLIKIGNRFVLGLFVLGLYAYWQQAKAEPANAPDVRGHFVLVVGGTATSDIEQDYWGGPTHYRVQPFTVGPFVSFKFCTSAGQQIQARLNSDGYTLDFVCVPVSK